jgi:hypothetical protein
MKWNESCRLYLFIYKQFNDAAGRSEYVVLHDTIITQQRIWMYDRSWPGPTEKNSKKAQFWWSILELISEPEIALLLMVTFLSYHVAICDMRSGLRKTQECIIAREQFIDGYHMWSCSWWMLGVEGYTVATITFKIKAGLCKVPKREICASEIEHW